MTLNVNRDLGLLAHVSLSKSHPLCRGQDWPSWVPTWSEDDHLNRAVKLYGSKYNAADGSLVHATIVPNKSILRIKGLDLKLPRGNDGKDTLVEQLLCTMTCDLVRDLRKQKPHRWPEQLYSDFIVWAVARCVVVDPTQPHFTVMDAAALALIELLETPYDRSNPDYATLGVFWRACAKRVSPNVWYSACESIERRLHRLHPDLSISDIL